MVNGDFSHYKPNKLSSPRFKMGTSLKGKTLLPEGANSFLKVSKGAKIRNRYNQVPCLTQDTNGKVTNSQLDTTYESQEVSPFPAGDHKAHINRRAEKAHQTQDRKKRSVKYFIGRLKPVSQRQPHPLFRCGSRHIDIWVA